MRADVSNKLNFAPRIGIARNFLAWTLLPAPPKESCYRRWI